MGSRFELHGSVARTCTDLIRIADVSVSQFATFEKTRETRDQYVGPLISRSSIVATWRSRLDYVMVTVPNYCKPLAIVGQLVTTLLLPFISGSVFGYLRVRHRARRSDRDGFVTQWCNEGSVCSMKLYGDCDFVKAYTRKHVGISRVLWYVRTCEELNILDELCTPIRVFLLEFLWNINSPIK